MPLAILHRFDHYGRKWRDQKLQSCRFPGVVLHLHDGLMQRSQTSGKGLGRCVLWVTLSRLTVGANTENAISL